MDTRDKHEHDERGLRSGGDLATTFPEPDSRGLGPGIHVLETERADPNEGVDGRDKPGHSDLGLYGVALLLANFLNQTAVGQA